MIKLVMLVIAIRTDESYWMTVSGVVPLVVLPVSSEWNVVNILYDKISVKVM